MVYLPTFIHISPLKTTTIHVGKYTVHPMDASWVPARHPRISTKIRSPGGTVARLAVLGCWVSTTGGVVCRWQSCRWKCWFG